MYRCKIPALLVAGGNGLAGDKTELLGLRGCRQKVRTLSYNVSIERSPLSHFYFKNMKNKRQDLSLSGTLGKLCNEK